MLTKNPVQNVIPWKAVWNGNSISTSYRLVFDASQPTASGTSLKDILAEKINNMNKFVEIIICWSTHKITFHTDVKKDVQHRSTAGKTLVLSEVYMAK